MYGHPGSISPHRILRTEKNAQQKRKILAPAYPHDPYVPYHHPTADEGYYRPQMDLTRGPSSPKTKAKPYVPVNISDPRITGITSSPKATKTKPELDVQTVLMKEPF